VATPALQFTDDPHSQIDDILWRICAELQISPTRYQQAADRYEAVCQWLEADASSVGAFHPSIYPQGSMRIGTTVHPLERSEHDLDFVCEFLLHPRSFDPPSRLLNLIEARLREHKVYASILEVKNRCIRLNYANEFHLDILPACTDASSGKDCIVVPDRKLSCWKPSNPKGYADWFEQRCELAIKVLMAERSRVLAKAEPIPDQEATREKATLKRAVQLIKRWRDVRYAKNLDLAPISMVLTTLAAQTYEGQYSVSNAISAILDRIIALVETSKPRIVVLNPANLREDLSERWHDPAKYGAFVSGIREFQVGWTKAMMIRGIPNVASALEKIFGEPVTVAVRKQADAIQAARQTANLRAMPSGIISSAPAIGTAIRSNTFHRRW
jgi:SMODS domain-containing protein